MSLQNLKHWFNSLQPRERQVVAVGGVILPIVLLYLLLIDPLYQSLVSQRDRIASQQQLLHWMQQSAQEAKQLMARSPGNAQTSTKAPYLLIDEAIRRAGLPAPSRLEPQGSDAAIAQFESLAFDRLMPVLASLQATNNLTVTDMSIVRREDELVSATLNIKRSGS